MREQVTSFEAAKLAKEKGFFDDKKSNIDYLTWSNHYDGNGNLWWNSELGLKTSRLNFHRAPTKEECVVNFVPTQSFLQKWLRDVHDINMLIECYPDKYWVLVYKGRDSSVNLGTNPNCEGDTYEEALDAGLIEALKLI